MVVQAVAARVTAVGMYQITLEVPGQLQEILEALELPQEEQLPA
jgi:hypothetical protein